MSSRTSESAEAPAFTSDASALVETGELPEVDIPVDVLPRRSINRRRFLLNSAATAGYPSIAAGSSSSNTGFERTGDGFELRRGDRRLWVVRIDWLCRASDIEFNRSPASEVNIARVALNGGSRLDMSLRIFLQPSPSDKVLLRLEHSAWREPIVVELAAWVSGAVVARGAAQRHKALFRHPSISVTQRGDAELVLEPDLTFRLEGAGAFRVAGRAINGIASSCSFGPSAAATLGAGSLPAARRLLVALSADTASPLIVTPHAGGDAAPRIESFETAGVVIEPSAGRTTVGDATITALPTAPLQVIHVDQRSKMHATVSLSNARYTANRDSQTLAADGVTVAVRTEDAVLQGRSAPGTDVRISTQPGRCAIACRLEWDQFSFAHEKGISALLRIRRDEDESCVPHPMPTPDNASVDDFLDGAPWHPSHLDLDRGELEFMRPEDGLWLRFRFRHFELERGLTGFRLRSRHATPRMWLVLPPQSVAEQAFFRAPGSNWASDPNCASKSKDAFGIPLLSADNEARKVQRKPLPAQDRARDCVVQDERPPTSGLARGRVAGESVLCFEPKSAAEKLSVRLEDLLDPQCWRLVIADSATGSLTSWRKAHPGAIFPADLDAAGLSEVTHIEMPWRLQISPTDACEMGHGPLHLPSSDEFHPLFYLSASALNGPGAPFRAIHSADHSFDTLQSHDPRPGANRRSLDARDRNELVWLTSAWGRAGLLGTKNVHPPVRSSSDVDPPIRPCPQTEASDYGIYEPQPFTVDQLRLTAFGGGMQSAGNWDPPFLQPIPLQQPDTTCGTGFALSVEQWQHRSSQARTHFERVVYRGWLMPFGFRAVLIKVTRREVENWDAVATAPLVQRYFIRVVEPVLQFPLVGQPVASLNGVCQPEKFEFLLKGDLQIDDPTDTDSQDPKHPYNLADQGQSAFVVRAAGDDKNQPYQFPLRIGDRGTGTCALAFFDNTTTHDKKLLGSDIQDATSVIAAYNGLAAPDRTLKHDGGPVRYAPSTRDGDTEFPTDWITFSLAVNTELIDSTLLEAAHQPPIYPVTDTAQIFVRSIRTQTGDVSRGTVQVRYNPLYRVVGFDARSNAVEAFLDLEKSQPLTFRGHAERSGGVANSDATANSLSRLKGLLAFSPTPGSAASSTDPRGQMRRLMGAATATSVSSKFTFDPSARILGTVAIVDVLSALGLGDLPQLVEEAEQQFANATGDIKSLLNGALGPGKDLVATLRTLWKDAGPAPSWPASAVYREIDDPLTTLFTALDKPDRDPIKAIAEIGRSSLRLRDAIEVLEKHPELALSALLRTSDFSTVLDAAEKLRSELSIDKIDALYGQAEALADDLRKRLRVEQDSLAINLGIVSAGLVSSATNAANEFLRQLDLMKEHKPSQIQDALSVALALAAQLESLYLLLQGVRDEGASLLVSQDAATAKAMGNFATQTAALVGAITATTWRDVVGNAAGAWQTAIDEAIDSVVAKELQDDKLHIVSDGVRAVEAHLRRVQVLLQVVRNREFPPHSKPAPRGTPPTNDLTFLRIGLVLVQEVDAVCNELAPSAQPPQWKALANSLEKARDALASSGFSRAVDTLNAPYRALAAAATALQPLATKARVPQLSGLLQRVIDASKARGSGTANERLQASLALAVELLDSPACFWGAPAVKRADSEVCGSAWHFYGYALDAASKLFESAWLLLEPGLNAFAVTFADNVAPTLPAPARAALDLQLVQSILGNNIGAEVSDLVKHLNPVLRQPSSIAEWVTLARDLHDADLPVRLTQILRQFDRAGALKNIATGVVEQMKAPLTDWLRQFVPARVKTTYVFKKTLDYQGTVFMTGLDDNVSCAVPDPGADGDQFNVASQSRFNLTSNIEADLINGTSSYSITGKLQGFRISLLGFIVLPIGEASFEATSTSGFKLNRPSFCAPDLQTGPLAFIQEIMDLVGGESGIFVEPRADGVRAGYRIREALIQTGGMAIQNFGFEAALDIPFDDRAAEISVAMATRDAPVLLSIGIYGGGAFFELIFAADRVISIAASFEAGLVGAFDLPAVTGSGRVTIGLYYHQSADGTVLEGFFYCGGHASVLGIVSIVADLTVRVIQSGGSATGTGRFSVKIGYGFFSWSLQYSVSHSQGGSSSKSEQLRLHSTQAPPRPGGCQPTKRGSSSLILVEDLLHPPTWRVYEDAFMVVAT